MNEPTKTTSEPPSEPAAETKSATVVEPVHSLKKQVDYGGATSLTVLAFDANNVPVRLRFVRCHRSDGTYDLVRLGLGRTAKVFLGEIIPDPRIPVEGGAPKDYVAVKCLVTDPDPEYRDQMRSRFEEERRKTRLRARRDPTFVCFRCYGWLDLHARVEDARPDKRREIDNEAISLRQEADKCGIKPWRTELLADIGSSSGGEALEGAFYAMELCQGSLLDVLEGAGEWQTLPYYGASPDALENLQIQQRENVEAVLQFERTFFPKGWKAESYSGYEILNAFDKHAAAELMRGRMVLDLAKAIALLMRDLHRDTRGVRKGGGATAANRAIGPVGIVKEEGDGEGETMGSESLAHRDLKPGNILLWHGPGAAGLTNLQFRLSDLGYLVGLRDLKQGGTELSLNHWRAYQVPGSPYYRAPEQMRQSIEVRLRIVAGDTVSGTLFEVFSSKADHIEPGDYLALPAVDFSTSTGRLLVILEVLLPERSVQGRVMTHRRLRLRVAGEAMAARDQDFIGHIVKATGVHTDGYSFGAMLYDLVSGGKNPEEFYQYCLQYYQYSRPSNVTKVSDVVEEIRDQLKNWIEQKISAEDKYARFLRDARDVEIPKDILAVICRCMLRDFSDSFYRQASPPSPGAADSSPVGWITDGNIRAFDEIYKTLEDLWNKKYKQPDGVPGFLADHTLLRLRCLGRGSLNAQASAPSIAASAH